MSVDRLLRGSPRSLHPPVRPQPLSLSGDTCRSGCLRKHATGRPKLKIPKQSSWEDSSPVKRSTATNQKYSESSSRIHGTCTIPFALPPFVLEPMHYQCLCKSSIGQGFSQDRRHCGPPQVSSASSFSQNVSRGFYSSAACMQLEFEESAAFRLKFTVIIHIHAHTSSTSYVIELPLWVVKKKNKSWLCSYCLDLWPISVRKKSLNLSSSWSETRLKILRVLKNCQPSTNLLVRIVDRRGYPNFVYLYTALRKGVTPCHQFTQ